MVWVIVVIIRTIGTIIATKHTYVKIICVYEGHLKRKRKCMEHHFIPSMVKVVFLLMGFLHPFVWASFCVFHSTRVSTSPHSPSKTSHTYACAIYTIPINTLFMPPRLTLGIHTKSTFEKKGFYWALDLN
jgi:hypothetical protein